MTGLSGTRGWWRSLAVLVASAVALALTSVGGAVAAPTDTVILNPSGGTNATNGLRIEYKSTGFQVFRNGNKQFYGGTPASMGWYVAVPGRQGSRFTSSATPVLSDGGTRLTNSMTATTQGVTYGLQVVIDYISPSDSFRIRATLSPTSGTAPANVIAYWGNDAYLGGNDSGYSYTAVRGGKREVGVSANQSGAGATEWARYSSGPEWTGYFAGFYGQYGSAPNAGSQYSGVAGGVTDNGYGWSATVNPATAPTFEYYVGFGDFLPPSDATPPSEVQNIVTTEESPNAQDVTVTWDPPSSDGGSPVQSYEITLYDSQGAVVGRTGVEANVRAATFSSMPNSGSPYRATVAAVNAVGSSESTAPVVPDPDSDSDGVADDADNCREVANSGQEDADSDGAGDACDSDRDGDGVANAEDAFPNDPAESADRDGDGIGDNADSDRDGDGVPNSEDAFPDDAGKSTEPPAATPKPDPEPTPPRTTPVGRTQLQVDAGTRSRPLQAGKRAVLVRRVNTDGDVTSVRAWCKLDGNRLRGRVADRLCDMDVDWNAAQAGRVGAAAERVRVTARPACVLRLYTTVTAKKPGSQATSWTRSWRVKGPQCRVPGTG